MPSTYLVNSFVPISGILPFENKSVTTLLISLFTFSGRTTSSLKNALSGANSVSVVSISASSVVSWSALLTSTFPTISPSTVWSCLSNIAGTLKGKLSLK